MKRLLLLIVFFAATFFALQAQNVSNVAFRQEGDMVVVTYSLDKPANVSVRISTNGGALFTELLKQVLGDVGENVSAGSKRIIWDALSEYGEINSNQIVFQITAMSNSGSSSSKTSNNSVHNGHEYVDLGLPSGLLWATCNIGATNPGDYGNYYAWGETVKKTHYSWSTYKYGSDRDALNRYNTRTNYGTVDNKTVLDPEDDVAHVKWGGAWRMPTDAEMTELREYCKWKWTTINGKKGYKVVSKVNNKWIFLPAAGYRSDSRFRNDGSYGYYWRSSLLSDSPNDAWYLLFNSSGFIRDDYYGDRCYGMSVRAVCPADSK